MKSATRLFFLVYGIGIAFCGRSQEYVISHDMNSNRTEYFKVVKQRDTVRVKSIATRRAARISLNIGNFNPFYWNARVTAIKKPTEEQTSNAGVFNPLSLLSKGLGGLVENIIPDLDLGKLGGRGGGAEPEEINSRYLFHLARYQQLHLRYQRLFETAADLQMLRLHLQAIKYSTDKTGAQIKQEARDALLNELGTTQLSWEAAIDKGRQMNRSLRSVADSLVTEQQILNELMPGTDPELQIESVSARSMQDKVNRASQRISNLNTENPDFVKEMAMVSELYNEIVAANYHFNYIVSGTEDVAELKLQLYPRSDSLGRDTVTKYFSVKPRPNVKIRNAVGLAFTHFKDKNRTYFVKPDTTIGSDRADLFTPVLATYINFYPATLHSLKIGGAFGFGIPVTGERKDINYMLGISVLAGKNEPVIITVGVAGTNVSKLANGYRTGDKVEDLDVNLPRMSVFRAGMFFSLSFNLGSVVSNR